MSSGSSGGDKETGWKTKVNPDDASLPTSWPAAGCEANVLMVQIDPGLIYPCGDLRAFSTSERIVPRPQSSP